MSKAATIKTLDSIIGKLSHLNYKIEGNTLQTAIREVAYAKNLLETNQVKLRKAK